MKKTKLILVGYGNMGKEWRKIINKRKDIQLLGVIDILEKNRIQALIDFSLKDFQVADNLQTLLLQYNPHIVIDSSTPQAHFQNTSLALNHFCHVLGEKPMSMTLKEAKVIISLSKAKKRIYMVNQNYRRNPIIQIIKDKMNNIGKVYSINIDYYQSLEFKDTFRYTLNHPLLLDMSIHHFDLVRAMINQSAESVYASEYNPVISKFKNGSSVFAHFKMNKGTMFSYRGSWSSIGFKTSFNGQWKIIGEYGTLIWDGDLSIFLEKRTNSGEIEKEVIRIPTKFRFNPHELFLYELEQNLELLLSSISGNSLPDCWCGDNIDSLAMSLTAIESSETGKAIILKKLNK